MNTLFLSVKLREDNTPEWDLAVSRSGNIALATGNYAIAQDIASAVRVFLGELWYDTTQGVPYFEQILGQMPSYQFMKSKFIAATLTVPGVASAQCFLTGPGRARAIGGQIQATLADSTVVVVASPQMGVLPWYARAVNVYSI